MWGFGTLRCRSLAPVGLLLASIALTGCSTVGKTLDFSSDPRLDADKNFPNINLSGPTQPGKLLTPEQQAAEKQALTAKAAAISPDTAAAAKAQGAASAAELQAIAKSHGAAAGSANANCPDGSNADATKCPQ